MPKIHRRMAKKDHPGTNIKAGDLYYAWKAGWKAKEQKSLTPPRRSQLTANPTNQVVYDMWDIDFCDKNLEAETLKDCANTLRELADEEQEKYDNLPEGLQGGERGEYFVRRVDSLYQAVDTLEGLIEELEAEDLAEDRREEILQEIADAEPDLT